MNRIDFRTQFSEAIDYLKRCRWCIFLVIFVFFFFSFIGFAFRNQLHMLDPYLREVFSRAADTKGFYLFLYILQNNVQASFYGLAGGALLGLFPIITTVLNGLVLGYVGGLVIDTSSVVDLWRLLPHGIFELPAVFISLGLGIYLGLFLFSGSPRKAFFERLYQSANAFLVIVFPLFLLAAVIESVLIAFV